MLRKKATGRLKHTKFPPLPLRPSETHAVLTRYCDSVHPSRFMERGCAVCGYLTKLSELTPLSEYKGNL
ncbi:hypothetical protein DFH06DRAFT_1012935, partial [Mycena polygramma]